MLNLPTQKPSFLCSVQRRKHKPLKITKEMLWCCICNIFKILLNKIYAKNAVQSPFLGLKMLWPLGTMPTMPSVIPVVENLLPSSKSWMPGNMELTPEQRLSTGKEQGSNISNSKLQQLSNQEMYFPRVYVFLSFLYVFLWFILSFPKYILTSCLSLLGVL